MIADKTIAQKIFSRIRNRGRGAVFTANDFADLGTRSTIDWVMQQLTDKETINRLCRGIYYYPVISSIVGLVPPSPEAVARSITKRDGSKFQASGAYAANLLGLSEQLPAQIIFLTSSDERTLFISRQKIILKKTTPRIMKMAGRTSGLITQAFKYLGKESINSAIIQKLKTNLTDQDKSQLKQDLAYPPAWIADYFRKLIS